MRLSFRDFLKAGAIVAAGIFAVIGGSSVCRAAEETSRPNLLFIFSDDQRWDAIGYVNPLVHTPNLDKLSAGGVRFTQAFITMPVCKPSRATALTGRYTIANGVTTYHNAMKKTETSFATYLNQADYYTAMVGKWHIPARDARNLEFQDVRQLGSMAPYWNPPVIINGKKQTYQGYSTDFCVEHTIYVIEKSQRNGKPFAIWLCPQAPHGRSKAKGGNWLREETERLYSKERLAKLPVPPHINDSLEGKPPYLKTYRGRRNIMKQGPMTAERYRSRRGQFGQITEMDHSLGKLFEALATMGCRENTYIVYMSDNGIFNGDHGFMSKGLAYEEAVRVPMFVVGPGIQSGYDDSLVTNADIAPTLLDLTGIKVPENMHGRSLKRALLEQNPQEREYVLLEAPDANEILETRPWYALRSNRWKYIQTFENGKDQPYTFEELYDLQTDRFETNNVVNQPEHGDIVKTLRTELARQRVAFAR